MRERIMILFGGLAAVLLVRNLFVMFLRLPDEAMQGAIFRIIFFHVPAAWTAFLCCFIAFLCSILYLATKNLRYDSVALAATEVGLACGTANLISGMFWGRIIWGIWWTWDPRLTSMLVGWLIYAGYLMLRRAIEEPTERAKMSAVLSIFAFTDVPIIFFSIKWWRTQHPQPVVWAGGKMDPEMFNMLFMNWIPLALLAIVFVMIRMEQERKLRQLDAQRRETYAL